MHSPTPWKITAKEPFCPELIDANGRPVEGIRLWEDDVGTSGNDLNDLPRANARRAAACVNACAGLPDPALAVSTMQGSIERLEYAISQIGFYFAGTKHQNVADITLRILAGESMQDIHKSTAEESAALTRDAG